VDAVREKARDEIRQFLTPEQKAKFEVMVQRMDAQRKQQKQAAEK
jgi:Spy/CpxP family protein refolding chaperone